ncbi:hypothetical protein LCGC14_2659820, partial [marine sediment metagenome]
PWRTATTQLTADGLDASWRGFVWCNPPYGPDTWQWLDRMALHGEGIALIFARTETEMFFECMWEKAWAVLFLKGRLTFCRPDGPRAEHNSGAPSVLVAYGAEDLEELAGCDLAGQYIQLMHCR